MLYLPTRTGRNFMLVAEVVLKALEDMDLKWPELISEKFKSLAVEK